MEHFEIVLLLSMSMWLCAFSVDFLKFSKLNKDVTADVVITFQCGNIGTCLAKCKRFDVNYDAVRYVNGLCSLYRDVVVLGTDYTGSGETYLRQPVRTQFGSSMYLSFSAERSWQDAQNTCELMGGHLVTITTQEENNFVLGLRVDPLSDTWVGANDLSVEGNFTWITGEEWTYSKFTNADGWNGSHDDTDCMLIKRDQFESPLFSNKFDDAYCSRLVKFVCEMSL
ncbi:PGCB-like protein [Mya arenaria]|uniref:PGCB-like protein n=1 Tax=Mya arenaria TaxID=6604 RepID=A0ABY7F751_MYAAR|nr:alpha-N-acetylgalactosamine-specific lectin-like [Mya arenaria]XP_052762544.1 alpha-N-acetylgalactosamine-specific lectin-like [Mya arenaria]WAR16594.1 PGCB-like protein [Mya arenaria]